MKYRYLAASSEGVVQLIAASYLRHGYYWYVTGTIPVGKSPLAIDQKLIDKYQIDITEWARSQRRKRGLANVQYIRFNEWFILLVTAGHHQLKSPCKLGGEGESLKDCRRVPIKFAGYSISYRQSGVCEPGSTTTKWHAHVRIERDAYMKLKSHFEYLAVHRSPENLRLEFAAIPYARYAPVRRQLLNLLRHANKLRQHRGFELLTHHCLALRRKPVKVFAEVSTTPLAEQDEVLQ